jgi:hypothetical protein
MKISWLELQTMPAEVINFWRAFAIGENKARKKQAERARRT